MTPYDKMVCGRKYFIYQPSTKYFTQSFYKGDFIHLQLQKQQPILYFENVVAIKYETEYLGSGNFGIEEIYYDVEIIKENAKKARQSMEKRALDKILKRLIEPNFKW